jgi:hypothetical protein
MHTDIPRVQFCAWQLFLSRKPEAIEESIRTCCAWKKKKDYLETLGLTNQSINCINRNTTSSERTPLGRQPRYLQTIPYYMDRLIN